MEHFALEILMERVEDEGANEQAFEMTFGNQENSHITKSEKKTSGYEDKKTRSGISYYEPGCAGIIHEV